MKQNIYFKPFVERISDSSYRPASHLCETFDHNENKSRHIKPGHFTTSRCISPTDSCYHYSGSLIPAQIVCVLPSHLLISRLAPMDQSSMWLTSEGEMRSINSLSRVCSGYNDPDRAISIHSFWMPCTERISILLSCQWNPTEPLHYFLHGCFW